MNYQPSPLDKEAVQVIENLAQSLSENVQGFEWATSNPQQFITKSTQDIRAALFELARWQNNHAVHY